MTVIEDGTQDLPPASMIEVNLARVFDSNAAPGITAPELSCTFTITVPRASSARAGPFQQHVALPPHICDCGSSIVCTTGGRL